VDAIAVKYTSSRDSKKGLNRYTTNGLTEHDGDADKGDDGDSGIPLYCNEEGAVDGGATKTEKDGWEQRRGRGGAEVEEGEEEADEEVEEEVARLRAALVSVSVLAKQAQEELTQERAQHKDELQALLLQQQSQQSESS
jgi:hypothetical protein